MLVFAVLLIVNSCQETEFRTHYPESKPTLTASVAENSIQYGDSITLTADVSDPNPLSTLDVMISVSSKVILKKSVQKEIKPPFTRNTTFLLVLVCQTKKKLR